MKYLVSYLKEYALKHINDHCIEMKIEIEKNGKETPIWIDEKTLYEAAANRIEFLERRLKELEKIDKVLKMLTND